jgi:hypothetical protein
MKLLRSLALPFALLAPCGAQEADPPRVVCPSCDHRGERDCPQHKKAALELEHAVLFCSEAADCKRCAGALTIDCKICGNDPVEAAIAARAEAARAWVAERRKAVDEYTKGRDILHCQTANVDLTFSLRGTMIGRERYDSHRLMHLYAERLEQLRASFIEVFGLGPRDWPVADAEVSPRLSVYMFDSQFDHAKIAPRVTGIGGGGAGVKLMGIRLAYSMYHDRRLLPDDEAVHRSVTHNVAHLLLSSMIPTVWIGNRGHGWIDEGVAHYFEHMVDGRCTNFCYEEVGLAPGSGFKNGKWRNALRKLAEARELRPFTELYEKNSDQLDFEAHAHAFGWVEFLIGAHGGPKFAELVRAVKRGEPTRDALKKVYGLSPLVVDDQFAAWVKANYPLQEK